MSARTGWLISALLLMSGALAACRNASAAAPPPTLTPTPMSTPLATLPPTLAPGSADNPIRFLIVSDTTGRAANAAVAALADALQAETGLTVDVALVSSDRDAVEALCNAFDGPPALALVSAPGYSAAAALNCGLPLFLLSDDVDSVSRELVFIASGESGISSLAGLAGSTFCRLSANDLMTWQVPALWMLADGLPPTSTLIAVTDVPSLDALVEQVASGDCDAAALALDDFERSGTPELEADITRLPSTLDLPLGVVVAARELPLGVREAISEALSVFGRTAAGADALETLAGAAGIVPYTADALADWDGFIARTGIDFASFQG
ncbi:MAG: PhnD/SsuA/transferrin family substrate-binding protein [Anaerolineae bacterium]|nr:PhnD/SsuA/transferrin family substrate-binding protein [Anaerolineae bacterium]